MTALSKAAAAGKAPRREPAPPPVETVQEFHTNADTDGDSAALHHTTGPGANQAASGDHNHDGGSSSPLFQGVGITGVRGSAAYYSSLEALLSRLGASNSATGP
jgi:hypothetical protein